MVINRFSIKKTCLLWFIVKNWALIIVIPVIKKRNSRMFFEQIKIRTKDYYYLRLIRSDMNSFGKTVLRTAIIRHVIIPRICFCLQPL